jgi:hypothetical protein
LAIGATVGDLIEVISFQVSSVLNAIPATTGAVGTSNLADGSVTKAKMGSGSTWAPAGTVVQVVSATTATQTGTSTNAYVDTTLTATITPTNATSRILVIVHQNGLNKQTGNTGISLRLVRGATTLNVFGENVAGTTNTTENSVGGAGVSFLDSPATTSPTTYKTQFSSTGNVGQAIVQHNNITSYITLMEIAA